MLYACFEFLGYVFAFWVSWKAFDTVVHLIWKPAEIEDNYVGSCKVCKSYSRRCSETSQELKSLKKENEKLKDKRWIAGNKIAAETIALSQINIATKRSLKEINGVGPKRAEQIINSRPFLNWEQFYRHPGYTGKKYVVRWAAKRVGLPHWDF